MKKIAYVVILFCIALSSCVAPTAMTPTMAAKPTITLTAIDVSRQPILNSTATSTPLKSTPFPTFPTDYPVPKQTIEWAEMLTMEADRNLPLRPSGEYFPRVTSTRWPRLPLQGTPAGSGMIVLDYSSTSSNIRRIVALNLSHWVQEKGEDYITVYVGTLIADRSQGVVYVIRSDNGIPWDKCSRCKTRIQVHIIDSLLPDRVECGYPRSGQHHAKSQRQRKCSQTLLPP
ncbi:hypothetical protein HY772_06275, partial [Candidatus Woesearchaeota archaeon]|nr:hypothetical protein [Candidatus Woesearchaeota archaeon]